MPDIIFPSRSMAIEELIASNDKAAIDAFIRDNIRRNPCSTLMINSPYCLASTGPEDRTVLRTLDNTPRPNRDRLMCVIDDFGETTRTLAAFYDRHLAELDPLAMTSAGATASQARLSGVQKALLDYQTALDALHRHRGVGRGASARSMDLRREVKQKYNVLQQKYQTELKQLARHPSKNRGNAINNAQRGITLAERRASRHLYVANAAEAKQLDGFARNIRWAGNGLVALDAGRRAAGVYSTYQSGGNWQRRASIEATGFGVGGAAGIIAGNGVIASLTLIGLGATPVGWVILIGVGIAAGATVAYKADQKGREFATSLWDRH